LQLKLAGEDPEAKSSVGNAASGAEASHTEAWRFTRLQRRGELAEAANHVNRLGKVMHTFPAIGLGAAMKLCFRASAPQPTVMLAGEKRRVTAVIQSFWQKLPKAIEASTISCL